MPALWVPSLLYDGAAFQNLGGGARQGGTYSGNLNLRLYIDPSQWLGVDNLFGYVDVLWVHGGQPSRYAGDAQGISNISASPNLGLYEAWVQKNALRDAISLLIGLYDVNSEFYRLQTSGLFLNSSFGIGAEFGQSGAAGPSIFPRTAWGARATFRPGDYVSLQAAVLNGVPFERPDGNHSVHVAGDGALLLAEISVVDRFRHGGQRHSQRTRLGRTPLALAHDDKIAFGAWHYTSQAPDESDQLDGGLPLQRRGSTGYYVIGESLLFRGGENGRSRISGFVQVGYGDARVDRFGSYAGAGLTVTGLFRESGDDELGIAVNAARNGAHYRAELERADALSSKAERVVELSYLLPLNARLAFQPDLQMIHRPNTDPTLHDAVAVQLRFELSY